MKNRIGSFATIFLSALLFLIFFGTTPITRLNKNFTSGGGDALKDIYTTYYHAEYDTALLHSNCMNYPYGDHYTYTGCLPYISVPIRIMEHWGISNASHYIVGVTNLFILISLLLCSLFIFLILKELSIPIWLSVIGAVVITFLSPQLDRISTHLSLSYAFILPCLLYLYTKAYRTSKTRYDIWIGILLLFACFSHAYYLIFFFVFFVVFWAYTFLNKRETLKGWKSAGLAMLLQFVMPVALFMFLTKVGDAEAYRTSLPWGFRYARGRVEAIFLPSRLYRFSFLHDFSWESYAYIGFVSVVVCIAGVVGMVRSIIKKEIRSIVRPFHEDSLNIALWASLLLLIFALGVPLIWLPQYTLASLGSVAQLRAVGRFAWLFYYVINIIAFWLIARFIEDKKPVVKTVVMALCLFFYGLEIKVFNDKRNIIHEYAAITDFDNRLPENEWVKGFNTERFQAILPLPYYHIGTEHIWIEPQNNMFPQSVYASMKTGLPLMSDFASRSPIDVSYRLVSLCKPPYQPYGFINDLPNHKPLLVITPTQNAQLNPNETCLLRHAQPLFSANGLDFLSLEIDTLLHVQKDFIEKQRQKVLILMQDSLYQPKYQYIGWDYEITPIAYQGGGAKAFHFGKDIPLYDSLSPLPNCKPLSVSFLLFDYMEDLASRTHLEVFVKGADGTKKHYSVTDLHLHYQGCFDGWGLISFDIPDVQQDDLLQITIRNKLVSPRKTYYIDNLLFRSSEDDIVITSPERVTLNGFTIEKTAQP